MDGPGTDPLLVGLVAGDERAFAVLYDRFAARMYRAALRMLGRREDAEDVLQDVFLAVVRSHKKLGQARDLTAYMFAALHRAAGRYAARRSKIVAASVTAAVDEAVARSEQGPTDSVNWQRIQLAIAALPDEQREVLSLKIDGELTFAQIAEATGVNMSTVASRYHYALKKLKTSLAAATPSPAKRPSLSSPALRDSPAVRAIASEPWAIGGL